MLIYICSFTAKGRTIADKINIGCKDDVIRIKAPEQDSAGFVKEAFVRRAAIIFIGAAGIAVRMIAPFVKDKLSDSPVIVIDELGKFVIPLLSGHMGGANELCYRLSEMIEAVPVITTATDINGIFAIDVFARENRLTIVNREGIARVSSALLKKEKATMYIENVEDIASYTGIDAASSIPEELKVVDNADEADIILRPKTLSIGIGCKKDTDPAKLEEFVNRFLMAYDRGLNDSWSDVIGIASIDIKAKEVAIVELASKKGVPFVTFTAEELNAVCGEFSESEFVKEATGTGNVCERSAVALVNSDNAELILNKTAEDGMTIAIARKM